MEKRFNWIMRAAFVACLAFVYFFACKTHSCTFKAYDFLFTNLILAYVPAELSTHMNAKTPPVVFWILFPFWFFFYPNAPYMLTDFFHLAKFDPYIVNAAGKTTSLLVPDMAMWSAYTILSVGILVAAFYGTWGLDHVTDSLIERFNVKRRAPAKIVLVTVISAFAGAGIYLGRFPRLHTIDLFMRTRWAMEQIATSLGPKLLFFVALLTLVQMVFWALFKIVRHK